MVSEAVPTQTCNPWGGGTGTEIELGFPRYSTLCETGLALTLKKREVFSYSHKRSHTL